MLSVPIPHNRCNISMCIEIFQGLTTKIAKQEKVKFGKMGFKGSISTTFYELIIQTHTQGFIFKLFGT